MNFYTDLLFPILLIIFLLWNFFGLMMHLCLSNDAKTVKSLLILTAICGPITWGIVLFSYIFVCTFNAVKTISGIKHEDEDGF